MKDSRKARSISGLTVIVAIALTLFSCSSVTDSNEQGSFNWKTSSPEAVGLDSTVIYAAFDEGSNRTFIHSIVIVKDGYLVAEKYYQGGAKTARHVRSVSKSFLSAMVGIALQKGFFTGEDQKMMDFFPEYEYENIEAAKYDITIRDLIQMKAGFDNDHNLYGQLSQGKNWIKSTIELDLLYDPGTVFSYLTFGTHLLSGMLTKAAGISSLEFARLHLTDPMNIVIADWEKDPQGIYFGGNSMFFSTRDMAVLGYLYLNGGQLNGVQIVPREWVNKSLTNHRPLPLGNWGELKELGYGYLWWTGKMGGYPVYLAIGYGGQFVIVFPEIRMIIATNSDAYVQDWGIADAHERAVLDLVANHILPAIIE